MQNGYYQVTGAMVTEFNKLDITTNNLANVNTAGFKRDSVIVGDFERIYQEFRDTLPLENSTKEGAKFFNRTLNRVPSIVELHTDFSTGNMKRTDNKLDFALKNGDLFFAVMTPNGVRLTQDGSFVVNDEGLLSTKDGYKVLPSNFIEEDNEDIKIPLNAFLIADKNGALYDRDEKIDELFITRVKNINMLKKEGDKLFNMEDIEKNVSHIENADLIQQGFVQMSNVSAIREMTALIESNRLVQMYQKAMTAHMDDLNEKAITKLASTRA
jgi:flagellar basal-body rod protein FlgG